MAVDPETGVAPAPRRRGLRTGFTTGACAAAATRGACLGLRGLRPSTVEVPLPAGLTASFALVSLEIGAARASASVIKDAGDDPDVTHGAEIRAEVELEASGPTAVGAEWSVVDRGAVARRLSPGSAIRLRAGEGVGLVTRPGLGLPVGGPAINPVPRRMIARSVRDTLTDPPPWVTVTVGVRDGAALALRTLNGRLGITGGLSILGTTGVVRPYSTASWRASVLQGVDVAAAAGLGEIVASTGGRSEAFARALIPLPDAAFVEMGEFTGHLLQRARQRGIGVVHLAGMIGKLSKLAGGHLMTHVAGNQVDLAYLAAVAARAGADPETVAMVRRANTARHVQEIIAPLRRVFDFFDLICDDVVAACAERIGPIPEVRVLLFDFEGALLGRSPR